METHIPGRHSCARTDGLLKEILLDQLQATVEDQRGARCIADTLPKRHIQKSLLLAFGSIITTHGQTSALLS